MCVRVPLVDGVWAEWAAWSGCTHPYKKDTDIRCQTIRGLQRRERYCLEPRHNGKICSGIDLVETRRCYDVSGCEREDCAHTHTPVLVKLKIEHSLVLASLLAASMTLA